MSNYIKNYFENENTMHKKWLWRLWYLQEYLVRVMRADENEADTNNDGGDNNEDGECYKNNQKRKENTQFTHKININLYIQIIKNK